MVAKGLAQAYVDVRRLGDVALGGQGVHEHLIPALPKRGQSDELAAGPNCCWDVGMAVLGVQVVRLRFLAREAAAGRWRRGRISRWRLTSPGKGEAAVPCGQLGWPRGVVAIFPAVRPSSGPRLQTGLFTGGQGADLVSGLPVSDRSVPLVAVSTARQLRRARPLITM